MKMTWNSLEQFKKHLKAMSCLSDEIGFEITAKGLEDKRMNTDQIAMYDFLMPKENLSVFQGDIGEKVYLNSKVVLKTLGKIKDKKLIVSVFTKDDKVVVGLGDGVFNNQTLEFTKLEHEEMKKTLSLDPQRKFKILVSDFKEGIEMCTGEYSCVELNALERVLNFRATGEDGNVSISKPTENITGNVFVKALFSTEYIKDILKSFDKKDTVEVWMGFKISYTDYAAETPKNAVKYPLPLVIKGKVDGAELTYYLAPKIGEDDLEPVGEEIKPVTAELTTETVKDTSVNLEVSHE